MTATQVEFDVVAAKADSGVAGTARANGGAAAAKKTGQPRAIRQVKARGARGTVRSKSELELLAEISAKLDRVVAVLAVQGRPRDTQVAVLAAAGCDSTFIGTLVGMTAGAVRKLPGWRRAQGEAAAGSTEEPAP